jgi:putative transposase
LSAQGEKLRAEMKIKDGYAKLLKAYPEVLEDLIVGEYPSHPTIYKVVKDELDRKKKLKARHPGADIDHQVVQTIEENLFVTHSNQIWQADHTLLDVFVLESVSKENSSAQRDVIRDTNGKPIRPFLTIIINSYSGCLMGYYL